MDEHIYAELETARATESPSVLVRIITALVREVDTQQMHIRELCARLDYLEHLHMSTHGNATLATINTAPSTKEHGP